MDNEVFELIHTEARARANELSAFFSEIQKSVEPEKAVLRLNMLFLMDACESSLIDLERHKDFHRITLEDRHKRAGFLFKWLTHMRPVYVAALRQGPGVDKIARINAYFALLAALGELELDVAAFAREKKVVQNMLYAGTYRDINPTIWALNFCLLEKAYPLQA